MTGLRPPDDAASRSEAATERLLDSALATPRWNELDRARVRRAVEMEWRTALAAAPRPAAIRPRWHAAAASAAALLLIIGLAVSEHSSNHRGAVLGQVARTLDGGMSLHAWGHWSRTLYAGEPIRVADRLSANGPALITLAAGGTLRVASGATIKISALSQVTLEQGLIYVDCPPEPTSCGALSVATRIGVVEHLGTQFEIMSDDQWVRVRVREGRVRWTAHSGPLLVGAGTELLATSGGRIAQQPVPTYGRLWLWTAALAPDYPIEGRRLTDFLNWISRELGRPIEFADNRARQSAGQTILHGSIQGEDPLDALAHVLATTSLRYELADGIIRVHSNP